MKKPKTSLVFYMHGLGLAQSLSLPTGRQAQDEAETKMLENWDRIEVRLERAMALMKQV
jgi:hypothetical protein